MKKYSTKVKPQEKKVVIKYDSDIKGVNKYIGMTITNVLNMIEFMIRMSTNVEMKNFDIEKGVLTVYEPKFYIRFVKGSQKWKLQIDYKQTLIKRYLDIEEGEYSVRWEPIDVKRNTEVKGEFDYLSSIFKGLCLMFDSEKLYRKGYKEWYNNIFKVNLFTWGWEQNLENFLIELNKIEERTRKLMVENYFGPVKDSTHKRRTFKLLHPYGTYKEFIEWVEPTTIKHTFYGKVKEKSFDEKEPTYIRQYSINPSDNLFP